MKYCEALNIFTAFVLFFFWGGSGGVGEGGFTTLRNKCLEKNVQFPLKVTLVITSQFVEHSAATVGKGVILL